MKMKSWMTFLLWCGGLAVAGCRGSHTAATSSAAASVRTYSVTGEVRQVQFDAKSLVVKHEDVPGFMPAMTMPFTLADTNASPPLHPGDWIRFRLSVSNETSWIDQVVRLRAAAPAANEAPTATNSAPDTGFNIAAMPDFAFTNEFGQPVSLRKLTGTAFAFTFFFTRCPLPEFCPRLAKNFQAASREMIAMPQAPTNWHLFSISFDPKDTPPVLREYAARYSYDSNHWSFITGPPEQVKEMARGFGLNISEENGSFTHGFMTLVFDARGRLQNRWPVGGDTSPQLISELLIAATNTPSTATTH